MGWVQPHPARFPWVSTRTGWVQLHLVCFRRVSTQMGWVQPHLLVVDDTHELHLPSENAYLAHRHTLRLSLFTRARACAIALSLQYYTIAHIAPSPDTSCHRFKPSDTSSALATHPIA